MRSIRRADAAETAAVEARPVVERLEPLVMVISAWRDDEGMRFRIVHSDRGARRTRAVMSAQDVLALVSEVLDRWERDHPVAQD